MHEKVYKGLRSVVGRGNISQSIEPLLRPQVGSKDLETAYQQMAEAKDASDLQGRYIPHNPELQPTPAEGGGRS